MFKIKVCFVITFFGRLYVRVGIFYSQLENACMSALFHLEGKVWAHKTSLTPPLFIEVPTPSRDRSCIRGIDFVAL